MMKTEQHFISFSAWKLLRGLGYIFAAGVILFVGLFLYLQSDPAKRRIKHYVSYVISENTPVKIQMGQIRGNMFTGFDIMNVNISDAATGLPLAEIKKLHVSYSLFLLALKVVLIHKIEFHGLKLYLIQMEDGRWNTNALSGIIRDEPSSSFQEFQILVHQINVHESDVSLITQTPQGEQIHRFNGIDCLANVKIGKELSATISELVFESENPKIAVSHGSAQLRFNPSARRFEILGANLKTPQSQISLKGHIGLGSGRPEFDAHAEISALSLNEIGHAMSLSLPEATLTGTLSAAGSLERLTHRIHLKGNGVEMDAEGVVCIPDKHWETLHLSGQFQQLHPADFPISCLKDIPGEINAHFDFKGHGLNMPGQTAQLVIYLNQSDIFGFALNQGKITACLNGVNLNIEDLQLKTPYGRVSGKTSLQGLLQSGAEKWIHAQVNMEKFSPEMFFPKSKIKGSISINLQSDVKLPASLAWREASGRISGILKDSMVNGIFISNGVMEGSWTPDQMVINRAAVQSPLGKVDISGTLSVFGRWCDLNIMADAMDVARIQKIYPGFLDSWPVTGTAVLQGKITGSWDQVHASVQAQSQGLSYGNMKVDSVTVKGLWEGNLNQFSGHAESSFAGLKLGDIQIPCAELSSQFTQDHARITVNFQGGQNDKFNISGYFRDWLKPAKVILVEQMIFTSEDLPPLVNEGPAKISISPKKVTIENFKLESKEASLTIRGSLDDSKNISADVLLQHFDVTRVSDFWSQGQKITGSLSSEISLSGTAAHPIIRVNATLKDAAYENLIFSEISLSSQYKENQAVAMVAAFQGPNKIAQLDGALQMDMAFFPFSLKAQPEGLDLRFAIDGLKVSDLPETKNRQYAMDGRIHISGEITGDLENPRVSGEMKLTEGFLKLHRQKLTYEQMSADIYFTHNQVDIRSLRIKGEKEGVLEMNGWFTWDHFYPQAFHIRITGKDFFIPYQTAIAAKVIPDLELSGTWDAPVVTGALTLTQGKINLDWFYSDAPVDIEIIETKPSQNGTVELAENDSRPLPLIDPLYMDVKVNAPGNVWLKGTNENIEIKGTLTIKKSRGETIRLYGPLQAVRGTYRFYGKVFNITEGELTFIGQEDINPPWRAVGEIKIKDVTIIIRLAGDFEKVTLTLDSDPVMDQVDIISYLVFGQPSDALSQKESFTAGDAALSITGQMAVGEIREILGEKFSIDYLDLSTVGGDIRQGALTMGKYVAPRVFVVYRHGFSQESPRQVEVDYEINRNFTIQTQIDNESTSAVDLIWKHEF